MPTMQPYNPRRHFGDLLHAEMGRNPDIVVLAGDLGYKMWDSIVRDFPDRFHNMGAAEQLLLGAGVGFALSGKLPICFSITPFLLFRPAEWIRNYLNEERIKVKLASSGLDEDYAHDGFSHFAYDIPAYMDNFRNVECFWPDKNAEELEVKFRKFIDADAPALITLRR